MALEEQNTKVEEKNGNIADTESMDTHSQSIKLLAQEAGFDLCGITSSDVIPEAQDRYKEWIKKGYHGSMKWLEDTERRTDPRKVMFEAESVIMLAINYYSSEETEADSQKIARYARGRDYHKTIHTKLKHFYQLLKAAFPKEMFRYYVDYGPFLERPYAEKAGLGFIGKNGLLITQEYGSYVFLAEMITSMQLEHDAPGIRRCGTCTRCHTSCPTQAFVADGMLDAKKCIAYHTIESKEETIPEEISKKLSGWSFGCDVCQEVCPFNNRLRNKETTHPDLKPRYSSLDGMGEALLDDEAFLKQFAGTPIMRSKRKGIIRNLSATE